MSDDGKATPHRCRDFELVGRDDRSVDPLNTPSMYTSAQVSYLEILMMQNKHMRVLMFVVALILVVLANPVTFAASAQEDQPQQFGGEFDGLKPEQKRLVEDWIQRYNRVMGENRRAEETPELAMAYVSPTAFQCLTYEEGEEADTGMAPFQMLAGMRRANQMIGEISSLDEIATGIRIANTRARAVEQPYHQQFVLYKIAESLALEFQCGNRGLAADEIPEGSDSRFGKYFGAVLHLQAEEVRGETFALLWEKQEGAWKLISYEVEPGEDQAGVPDLRTPIAAGAALRVSGDEKLIEAAKGFLMAWFVDRDIDKSMSFISPQAYSCVNLFLGEGETPRATAEEKEERLRLGLQRTLDEIGTPESLDEAIRAIAPTNPDIAVVTHPDEDEFSLLSMPNYLAAGYGCDFRAAGGEPLPRPEKPSYGDYYAQAFSINMVAGEPAALGLLWGREGGSWKITSYVLLTP